MKERGRGRQKVRKMERGRRGVGAPGRWLLGPPPSRRQLWGQLWRGMERGDPREDARVIAEQHIHGSGHLAFPKSQVHDDPGGKGWVAGKPACVLSRISGGRSALWLKVQERWGCGRGVGGGSGSGSVRGQG